MANAITKFGLPALGVGLLAFMLLFAATGGIGSCANLSQITMLLVGVACLAIAALIFLASIITVLIRKYKSTAFT
jgi:hypothetical protein